VPEWQKDLRQQDELIQLGNKYNKLNCAEWESVESPADDPWYKPLTYESKKRRVDQFLDCIRTRTLLKAGGMTFPIPTDADLYRVITVRGSVVTTASGSRATGNRATGNRARLS